MYDPKIQLEILDEIEATQDHRNIDEIDLTNPDRKQNYDFLLAERCVNERIEKTGDSPENNRLQKIGIALTHMGEKLRFDLHKQFQTDCRRSLMLWTTGAIFLLTLALVVMTLVLVVKSFV